MKRCGRCGETKPVEEFHRWARRDGRQAWCKACRKTYDAAYFQRNHDKRLAQKRRNGVEFMQWYRSLKEGQPCTDCGGVFPSGAMQWDHLPGSDKVASLGDLARKRSRRLVLIEIAKCELVCAICHAIRTVDRQAAP
jgi:hypothetical protein